MQASGDGISHESTSSKARTKAERDNLVPVIYVDLELFKLLHMQFSQALSLARTHECVIGLLYICWDLPNAPLFASASDEQGAGARA